MRSIEHFGGIEQGVDETLLAFTACGFRQPLFKSKFSFAGWKGKSRLFLSQWKWQGARRFNLSQRTLRPSPRM
jgi:hypothetical protein